MSRKKVNEVKTTETKKEVKTIDLSGLYSQVQNHVQSLLLGPLRELEDMRSMNRILVRRLTNLELEYKSLGFTIAELGLVELNLLNKTKNMVKDRLSIVTSNGEVKGKIIVNRYNLVPASDKLKIQVKKEVGESK